MGIKIWFRGYVKVVGMLAVYNDEEYVEEIIEYYISQGINLVVLDNGSTDKTFEKCENFFNQNKTQNGFFWRIRSRIYRSV